MKTTKTILFMLLLGITGAISAQKGEMRELPGKFNPEVKVFAITIESNDKAPLTGYLKIGDIAGESFEKKYSEPNTFLGILTSDSDYDLKEKRFKEGAVITLYQDPKYIPKDVWSPGEQSVPQSMFLSADKVFENVTYKYGEQRAEVEQKKQGTVSLIFF